MRKHLFLIAAVAYGAAAAFAQVQGLERAAFLDAESRFSSRDYAVAADRYDELIRTWPDSAYVPDAKFRRAVALYRLSRRAEAYAALTQVEARYRSTKYLAHVPFWMAVIDYDEGRYEKASGRFAALVDSPPDPATLSQSLLYLGKAQSALGQVEGAVASFERLLPLLPRAEAEPDALLFLADLYSMQKRHGAIADLWSRIDPDKLPAEIAERVSLRAAEALEALEREAEAKVLYEKLTASSNRAISVAALQRLLSAARRAGDAAGVAAYVAKAENALRGVPDDLGEFWLRVGVSAFEDGRLDLARAYFERISALLPLSRVPADASLYLAEIAHREGKTAEAAAVLVGALPYAGPREALMRARLGWYQLALSRWKDADKTLSPFASAPASAPADAAAADEGSYYLAYARYRQDLPAEGLSALASAKARGREADFLRAELLRRTGKSAESLQALDDLIAADPTDPEAAAARIALLFENDRFDRVVEAVSALDRQAAYGPRLEGDIGAVVDYMASVSFAALGDYASSLARAEAAFASGPDRLGPAAPWAAFYRAWSLYRLSRFPEAVPAFDGFLRDYPRHENAYAAAYLSAWSSVAGRDYAAAAASARRAADIAETARGGSDAALRLARAAFLEGTIRPFSKDWDGALAALDRAIRAGPTPFAVRAAFEKGVVLEAAGRPDAADEAFLLVTRAYPADPLAPEASYRRGEVMHRAQRWTTAADRFASYRQAYPRGDKVDAALYFGGYALSSSGKPDAGILLWERLLSDHPASRYRFPAYLAVGAGYKDKKDWQAAFRAYTSALAEFGDQARKAGAADEAETLRYLLTGLPEKAARLHVVIAREGGVASPLGRSAALELSRFYITEGAQKEAGLPLLEEVLALGAQDPGAAAEAHLLKGDFLASTGAWAKAADSYLGAVSAAAEAPASAAATTGAKVRTELAAEAMFKVVQALIRDGRRDAAVSARDTLRKAFPASSWTREANRLLEASR